MGVFEDQARDKSDWTDQDLLLYDEAEERLVVLEAQLKADLEAANDDVAVREHIQTRLNAAGRLLAMYRSARAT
jgi:hypothetical protein